MLAVDLQCIQAREVNMCADLVIDKYLEFRFGIRDWSRLIHYWVEFEKHLGETGQAQAAP